MGTLYYNSQKYGGSTTLLKPITKAEYDALSIEEKNADVMYAITDEDTSEEVAITQTLVDSHDSVPTSKVVYDLNQDIRDYIDEGDAKQLLANSYYGVEVESNDARYVRGTVKTKDEFDAAHNKLLVSKGTLNNVLSPALTNTPVDNTSKTADELYAETDPLVRSMTYGAIDASNHGLIITFKSSANYGKQIAMPMTSNKMLVRNYTNGTFSNWEDMNSASDITTLNNKVGAGVQFFGGKGTLSGATVTFQFNNVTILHGLYLIQVTLDAKRYWVLVGSSWSNTIIAQWSQNWNAAYTPTLSGAFENKTAKIEVTSNSSISESSFNWGLWAIGI